MPAATGGSTARARGRSPSGDGTRPRTPGRWLRPSSRPQPREPGAQASHSHSRLSLLGDPPHHIIGRRPTQPPGAKVPPWRAGRHCSGSSDATTRHLPRNYADVGVPGTACPWGYTQLLHPLTLGRVDDLLSLTADQHAPPLGQRVIEVIDLEGDLTLCE